MILNNSEQKIYFHDIISALSYALDLTQGQPAGHALRCCWIGMHIAQRLNLTVQQQHDLYYTLILKDSGCSSNAARLCELYGSDDRKVKGAYRAVDTQDKLLLAKFILKHCALGGSHFNKIKNFMNLTLNGSKISMELYSSRCNRGAQVARQLGLSEDVAQGIFSLDEHYNGKGMTQGLAGEDIPLYSRIALLTQVVDVFFKVGGKEACCSCVKGRSGAWFDPGLVEHFLELSTDNEFWRGLKVANIAAHLARFRPADTILPLTYDLLDNVAEVFGRVVDAKSPYTAGHSRRVAYYAMRIGSYSGMSLENQRLLYPAALLHDIGKLGISNTILDKRGALDANEWDMIRKHPRYTEEILSRFLPFHSLAQIAGAHHERLDGTGYPNAKKAEDISAETRIITIADIFDALTADRPYRAAIPVDEALKIMHSLGGNVLDNEYLAILDEVVKEGEVDHRDFNFFNRDMGPLERRSAAREKIHINPLAAANYDKKPPPKSIS